MEAFERLALFLLLRERNIGHERVNIRLLFVSIIIHVFGLKKNEYLFRSSISKYSEFHVSSKVQTNLFRFLCMGILCASKVRIT